MDRRAMAHAVGSRRSGGPQHLWRYGRALIERARSFVLRLGRLPGDELHFHDWFRSPTGNLDLGGSAMERRPNPGSHWRPLVQLGAGFARRCYRASILGDMGSDRTVRLRTTISALLALERVSRSHRAGGD